MIINPAKERGDPELPAAGLLLINPSEANAALRLAKSRNVKAHSLFNSRLMLIPASAQENSIFMAGPAVGAPMAALTLEKLIALGAEKVIVFSWCGSMANTLGIGDILLPTWAVSTEGTSAHYPSSKRPESHAPTRQLLADGLRSLGFAVQTGPVWSTDAPYRERLVQIAKLEQEGILGVDMEFAALAAVAAFRKVVLSAVFLVSDELWSGTWKPGFRSKEFKHRSGKILQFLTDFCQRLSSENF